MGNKHYKTTPRIIEGKYELFRKRVVEIHGGEENLNRLLRLAQHWHNPMNYSDGTDIKNKHGWDTLFTDHINGIRYYFPFHDLPDYHADTVLAHFAACNNMQRYIDIWKANAPAEIACGRLYFLAIVEMTAGGMQHEKNMEEKFKKEGREVRKSTPEEDYLEGIDLWVDGVPVQIKSPATEYMMR